MAASVEAEAMGVPGKRTFNVTATTSRGSAVVWMEKEQLFQVAIAIKRFLAARPSALEPAPHAPEGAPSGSVKVEFKAGDMSLRHDPSTGVLTLLAAPVEQPDQEEGERPEAHPPVQFSFTRSMGAALADRALEVCAAGRKPCPLCGGPIDPEGHFCVRTNGHRALDRPSG
jgi:uncharacterized repeat protein (TIGR03847 family)